MAGGLLTAAILLLVTQRVLSQTCFYPNGNVVDEHSPCPGVNASHPGPCCNSAGGWPHVDPCMSNGYCFSNDLGIMYRGSCTDKNWDSTSGCPLECSAVNPAGDAVLAPCSNRELCCTVVDDPNNNDCCAERSFVWRDATFVGPFNASTLRTVVDAPASINGISSTTITATATPEVAENKATVSKSTVIGVGVGLGLPMLICLATAVWLFLALDKERRNKYPTDDAMGGISATNMGNKLIAFEQTGYSQQAAYAQQQSRLSAYGNLDGQEAYQLPTTENRGVAELWGQRERAEAPGN